MGTGWAGHGRRSGIFDVWLLVCLVWISAMLGIARILLPSAFHD